MDPTDLYGLPLERFTEERNALAKQLRQDGEPERAAEVAKLQKPSVAAWAVNQLVRTQRREAALLFEAGDELQRVQGELLAGSAEPGALRSAVEAERAAAQRLTEIARGLLGSQGQELSEARLEQVTETLHAAALDPDAREHVREGCLVRELRHVGLGALGAAAPPAPKKRRTAADRRAAGDRQPAGDRKAAQERASQLKAARELEADARRRLERAETDLRAAEHHRERAAAALRDAEDAVELARERAQERAEAHRRAIEALDRQR